MSEDKKPIEVEAKATGNEVETEERVTGEMPVVTPPSEADAPKMPEAKASPAPTHTAAPAASEPAKAEKSDGKPDAKAAKAEAKAEAKADAKAEPKAEAKADAKADTKATPKSDEVRASRETMTMPVATEVGAPPAVPGDVENPTHMPEPTDVPSGSPDDPAQAPGHVPSGDSRSLRRAGEFALVYRRGTAVITRFGAVGKRGQWRVVEYPTSSSASNAYAKQCSQFVGEGFSDYRD